MRELRFSIIPENITFDQLDINYDDPSLMEFMIFGGKMNARFNKSGISTARFSKDGKEFLMSVEVKNPEGSEISKSELLDGNNFYDAEGFWNTKFTEGCVYDAQRKFQFGGVGSNILCITEELAGRPILKVGMSLGAITWQSGDYIMVSKILKNNSNCIKISHRDSAGTEKSSFDDSNGSLSLYNYDGQYLIESGNGPKLDAFRAPVDNDNWAWNQWFQNGLYNLRHKATAEPIVLANEDGSKRIIYNVVSQATRQGRAVHRPGKAGEPIEMIQEGREMT